MPSNIVRGWSANICYFHRPEPLISRLDFAAKLTHSKYVALLADDDLFLESGLNSCMGELETNSNLIACMGRTLGFRQSEDELYAWPVYENQAGYAVAENSPRHRVLHHMTYYTPSTVYSVVRRREWVAVISSIKKAMNLIEPTKIYALEEYLFESSLAVLGRSTVLSDLSWLRNLESDGATKNPTLGRSDYQLFSDWWQDSQNNAIREQVLELLSGELSQISELKDDEIREILREGFAKLSEFILMRHNQTIYRRIRFRRRVTLHFRHKFPKIWERLSSRVNKDSQALIRGGPLNMIDTDEILQSFGILMNPKDLEEISALFARRKFIP